MKIPISCLKNSRMNASNLVQYLSLCWVREMAERTANDDVIEVYCHYLIMRTHQCAQTGMNLQAYSDTVLRCHDDDASHGRWVIIQWWRGDEVERFGGLARLDQQ